MQNLLRSVVWISRRQSILCVTVQTGSDCRFMRCSTSSAHFSVPSSDFHRCVQINRLGSHLREVARKRQFTKPALIHDYVIRLGFDCVTFIGNCLIQAYGACGRLPDASAVAHRIASPNTFTWTILLTVCAQAGSLEDAKFAFSHIRSGSVVAANAMMSALLQHGYEADTLDVFCRMCLEGVQLDIVSFISALEACCGLVAVERGKQIHASVVEAGFASNVMISTTLIKLYGKARQASYARKIFDSITYRDSICWNTMIAALSYCKESREALNVFYQMHIEERISDKISFLCVADACAEMLALNDGQNVHAAAIEGGFENDVLLLTAILDMYGKCAMLDDAYSTFIVISEGNLVAWNALIGAFAQSGCDEETLNLFNQMQQQGVVPDSTTFLGVLTACSHTGLLYHSEHFLNSVMGYYGIDISIAHYNCIIDLLGRAGHLDVAESVFEGIKIDKDTAIWRCFLNACKIHGDRERGLRIANKCFAVDSSDSGSFVLLSNLHVTRRDLEILGPTLDM